MPTMRTTARPMAARAAPLPARPPGLDLYWIPLGAGARIVRASGRLYEGVTATVGRRPRRDLYHSALVAVTDEAPYVIEMTPIPGPRGAEERGVVAEGPVGSRLAGRLRLFRYEIRRWRDGLIPDLSYAVGGPVRVSDDPSVVRHAVSLVPQTPTLVWGRDERHTGDMWNSNSLIAWLLAHVGALKAAGEPPAGGRAPGWHAGVSVALAEPLLLAPDQSGAGG